MFWFSKLIESSLLAPNFLASLAVLGLFTLAFRRRPLALWIFGVTTVLTAVAGCSPVGPTLLMVLEDRFPPPVLPDATAGMILLGGAVDVHISQDRGHIALNENAERVTSVAALARRYPSARVILAGGIAHGNPYDGSRAL